MEYMRRLEERIEKLRGGLESMRLDTQSINAKVDALSKGKEKKKSHGSDRHRRHLEELKRVPTNAIQSKIPPFLGDEGPNTYLD
ncbi:hypothetical protein CR513_41245, partial [Mucuna pruriens]